MPSTTLLSTMTMASSTQGLSWRAFAFWTTAALACLSQLASAAITIYLATNARSLVASIDHTAWAASVFDIVAVIAAPGAAYLYVCRTGRQVQAVLCALFILLAMSGACLTMYTLAWIWKELQQVGDRVTDSQTSRYLSIAGFAVCSISVITHASIFTIVLWRRKNDVAPLPAQELTERPSPVRSVKRSMSLHLASLTPPRPLPFHRSMSEPNSPTLSTNSSSPKSSFRHSMHQAVRPVTSKTKLLLRHPSLSRDSSGYGRETSLEALRQDDEFGDWDTSAVEQPPVENLNESNWFRKTTKSRLETIPGSRPVSPAKALDGPFPERYPQDVYLPDSPIHSPVASPTSETGSFRFSRPVTRRGSSVDQSHIHPLFRSESPVSPPLASPGTVIVASPYAGQIISPEDQTFVPTRNLHSVPSFRAESPNPLSPPRSRQGSFRSFHVHQSPPGEYHSVASRPSTRDQSRPPTRDQPAD